MSDLLLTLLSFHSVVLYIYSFYSIKKRCDALFLSLSWYSFKNILQQIWWIFQLPQSKSREKSFFYICSAEWFYSYIMETYYSFYGTTIRGLCLTADVLLINGKIRRFLDRSHLGISANKLTAHFSFNVD